ncbi:MAG: hypothetical protein JSU85_16380 [Candidatus Zixiibacteriota bacterium]|nr:MAG: hypothetical protein JSU85_16380 [candidate division Zixibacteria bacterium]
MANARKKQTTIVWILTVVITVSSVIYQRLTGPTYPVRSSVEIDDEIIKYKLLRSHYSSSDAINRIETRNDLITGELRWRRLKSYDDWRVDSLMREGSGLQVMIPKQPPAGKIAYQVILIGKDGQRYELSEEPVVIRFKGDVPILILIPHVFMMFISMLLGTRTGLEALYKRERAYRLALWTSALFFAGGIILGPIVQKFAFGALWTGWPLGSDLTDNKTAVAMLGWLVALWRGRDLKKGRKWFVIAAVLQLLVYLIPHSMFGSELDYTQSDY